MEGCTTSRRRGGFALAQAVRYRESARALPLCPRCDVFALRLAVDLFAGFARVVPGSGLLRGSHGAFFALGRGPSRRPGLVLTRPDTTKRCGRNPRTWRGKPGAVHPPSCHAFFVVEIVGGRCSDLRWQPCACGAVPVL